MIRRQAVGGSRDCYRPVRTRRCLRAYVDTGPADLHKGAPLVLLCRLSAFAQEVDTAAIAGAWPLLLRRQQYQSGGKRQRIFEQAQLLCP
jgi:hypothetical protein